jgi:XXXCH domain-containing protein
MAESNSRYQEKLLKKSMSAIWKGMRRELEDGIAPRQMDWDDFMEKIDRYTQTAMPEWRSQWEECVQEIHGIRAALQRNDLTAARIHMQNAHAITKACHKKWKD